MEYGKPFGTGAVGGAAVVGHGLGYGWFVLGALIVTIAGIIGIRVFFRRKKSINIV